MPIEKEEISLQLFAELGFIACDTRLPSLINDTLIRLPEKDLDFLLYENNICIIQVRASTIQEFKPNKYVDNFIFILFPSDLCDYALPDAIYTIVHEFAHVYLGHKTFHSKSPEIEIEADKQVIKWGFEEELKQSAYSYIYGPKKT